MAATILYRCTTKGGAMTGMVTAFMPHGMCYLWQPSLILTEVACNGLIALAYYAIPVLLVYFIGRRPDIPNPLLFTLFAIFILACGTTHLFDIITIWHPVYWIDAFVRGVTAIASVGTAIVLAPLMPRLLRSGTVEHYLEAMSKAVLEDKNEALESANQRLAQMNESLKEQMALMDRSAAVLSEREQRIKELREENEQLRARLKDPGHQP